MADGHFTIPCYILSVGWLLASEELMIDFEQAKMLAEATAREELFWIISSSSLIDDYHVESTVCWIFLDGMT